MKRKTYKDEITERVPRNTDNPWHYIPRISRPATDPKLPAITWEDPPAYMREVDGRTLFVTDGADAARQAYLDLLGFVPSLYVIECERRRRRLVREQYAEPETEPSARRSRRGGRRGRGGSGEVAA